MRTKPVAGYAGKNFAQRSCKAVCKVVCTQLCRVAGNYIYNTYLCIVLESQHLVHFLPTLLASQLRLYHPLRSFSL